MIKKIQPVTLVKSTGNIAHNNLLYNCLQITGAPKFMSMHTAKQNLLVWEEQ